MKVTLDAASLREAADWAGRRTGAQTPIMSAVVLEATDDRLTARAGDGDTWAEAGAAAHVVTPGSIAVSGKLLRAVADAMPRDGRVDLSADAAMLSVACGRFRATLQLMPVEDYPTPPSMPPVGIRLPVDVGRLLAAAVPLALASEPSRCGAALVLEPEGVTVVALDSYRVFTARLPWPSTASVPEAATVLLSAATVRAMADAAKGAETLALAVPAGGETLVGLDVAGRRLACRTAGQQMNDWRKVAAPRAGEVRSLTVDAADLAGLIKRLLPTVDTPTVEARKHLDFTVAEGSLHMDAVTARDSIDCEHDPAWDVDRWRMRINAEYLLHLVDAADAERLRLDFTGPGKPIRITRVGSELFTAVIMPIRLPKSP